MFTYVSVYGYYIFIECMDAVFIWFFPATVIHTPKSHNSIKIAGSLRFHLKKLEKVEQMKPKVIRRKEMIKIRAEIKEMVSSKSIEKINETPNW